MTWEDLQEIRAAADYIRDMDDRLREMESRIERMTTAYNIAEGHGGKTVQDRMAEQIVEMVDYEGEMAEAIRKQRWQVRAAEEEFAALPWTQRRIMQLRYIDGMAWRKIAETTCYDIRWCMRLHAAALERLGIERQNTP